MTTSQDSQVFAQVLYLVPYLSDKLIFNEDAILIGNWTMLASLASQGFVRVVYMVLY